VHGADFSQMHFAEIGQLSVRALHNCVFWSLRIGELSARFSQLRRLEGSSLHKRAFPGARRCAAAAARRAPSFGRPFYSRGVHTGRAWVRRVGRAATPARVSPCARRAACAAALHPHTRRLLQRARTWPGSARAAGWHAPAGRHAHTRRPEPRCRLPPPRLLKAHNLVRTGFCSVVPLRPIRFIPCACSSRKRCNLRNYRDTVFVSGKTAATNRAGTGLCTTSCTGAHTLRGSFWDPPCGVLLRHFFARKCITRHRFARLRRVH
jgi:hypothetical protein